MEPARIGRGVDAGIDVDVVIGVVTGIAGVTDLRDFQSRLRSVPAAPREQRLSLSLL
jgi:hypothetical protein